MRLSGCRGLLVAGVGGLIIGCGGAPSGGGGQPAGAIPPGGMVDGVPVGIPDVPGGSSSGVELTPQTVTVDRATVAANLLHVSADGTYTFSSAAGTLASLAPGRVILMQGTDAAHVTGIDHSGGLLIVHTAPVTIPEVIQSGKFTYRGPIDFTHAFTAAVVDAPAASVPPSATSGSAALASPAGAMLAATLTRYRPTAAVHAYRLVATPSLTVKGALEGGWEYTAAIFGEGTGLNVKASLTLKRGSVEGLVSLDAHMDMGEARFDMAVTNDQVSQGGFSASTLNGKWRIEYAFGQGDSVDGNVAFPVLRIPFSWDVPWTVGGIPITLKVRPALIVKLGLSSKNATVKGGVEYNMNGQGGMIQRGSAAAPAAGTAGTAHGNVLGQSAGNVSISPAPSGIVVSLQVKVGPSLGISQANAVYYFDVVTSIGQTTGAAFAGMICSGYSIDITLGGSFEASVGISKAYSLNISPPRTVLFTFPQVTTKEPGCPSTS